MTLLLNRSAALVLMRESDAKERGLKPLARIVGHMTHAQKPSDFSIAPIIAVQKLVDRLIGLAMKLICMK